jgi:Holliday junction resolvasome RuvABC DNA-binding subunit
MTFGSDSAASKSSYGDSQLMQDAVSALVNLGYRKTEAEDNVRTVLKRGQSSLEEVLKEALRRMSL